VVSGPWSEKTVIGGKCYFAPSGSEGGAAPEGASAIATLRHRWSDVL